MCGAFAVTALECAIRIDERIQRKIDRVSRVVTIFGPAFGTQFQRFVVAFLVTIERFDHARRVCSYAAIDAARCQMATDEFVDGCDKLMWIDSDIVFDPNDVEKLVLRKF